MQIDGETLLLSPTDVTKHLACPHITTLDLQASRGEIDPPSETDDVLELIFRLGLEHERWYLAKLRESGAQVLEIPEHLSIAERVSLTEEALRTAADVIYQATFLHEGHLGHADFLLRAERPSNLGAWSYDVADTKLARRMKVAALLQMAAYGRHLERLQGSPPEWLTVITGDGLDRTFRYRDAAAYAVRATRRLREAVEKPAATSPTPCSHCSQCRWSKRCEDEWRNADHLSLVAFMRADHGVALEAAGICTVADLAAADPEALPRTIGESSRVRLQAQAALQVEERRTQSPHYELLDPAPGLGLLRLPAPSVGDVYLDFEGDPYAAGGDGREYLAGVWDRDGQYKAWWAHSSEEERTLTESLLADLGSRLDADPGMHVYHYAPYERTALARLTQRHGVGETNFDRLLRGETLVDLYGVVRQGLRISKGSYSIKKLEAFYWGGVRGSGDQPDDVADALSSVIAYERWLADRDDTILDQIQRYNQDDVRSTHDLHTWLEELREELTAVHGPQDRPAIPDSHPPPEYGEDEAYEVDLAHRLREAGYPLLGGLVGWHRRESRPQWWDFYRLSSLSDDDLIADGAAIGGLGVPVSLGPLPRPARSSLWRYEFPPQETKVHGTAVDVDNHKVAGTVHDIDPAAGYIVLKMATHKEPPVARAFGPDQPVDQRVLRDSLHRSAEKILAGETPLAKRLLGRVVPLGTAPLQGETARDAVLRVGVGLRDAILAVQGPPGTGKTTVGGELVRRLLDAGLRVGVTAPSHAVIGNLLRAVDRRALQKCDEDDYCGAPCVDRTNDNAAVVRALTDGTHNLVGGTAWLWARGDLANTVDVLVIDEAGQFSLANAVAVAQCASGLVLLGDPQQLSQPSQAQHPDGAGISALEHILDGEATVPPDRGVFLDVTWRMHPSLASIVSELMYDGRVRAGPGGGQQELRAPQPWGGNGIRWVPVSHVGNAAASSEEAETVKRIVENLAGSAWVDVHGGTHSVGLDDILIVAPYNAQVGRLRSVLPDGARVGTVDKFQGQEAPVVIYSMASSSAEDAPRGINFLYDLHRLNVAISRARCVAIIVASPTLLDAGVKSPEQLCSVNGLITVAGQ